MADPMLAPQDPVEIAKRKEFFARVARRTLQKSEQLRAKRLGEMSTLPEAQESKAWLTDSRKEAYDRKQLEYVKEYAAEYCTQVETRPPSDDQETDDFRCDASDKDTIGSLRSFTRSMRGKFNRASLGSTSSRASVNEFEKISTIMAPSESAEYTSNLSVDDIKRTYFSRYKTNSNLPIFSQKHYLTNCINSYSVVIIEGATGCGKTTQVPTYILEDAILGGRQTKAPVIYVTQPRRIAARSIAQRVCDEHNWEVGGLVGYQVGLEKRVGPDTVLVFCTAGVLLQKLITEKSLQSYTHIIIDEAHERDSDTDLLLMFIRHLMRQEASYFRLIVMSATMDMQKLKNYFTFRTNFGHRGSISPSIVKIQGSEPQDITILYLDRVVDTFNLEKTLPNLELDQPELHDEIMKMAFKIILNVIPNLDTFSKSTESTLVFLPGLAEITKMHNMLRKAGADHLDIIPLHSCLSPSDQSRVFLPARPGCRKVILATNIAESSITVRDVGFIIDFCLTKVLRKDSVTNFPALKLGWSSMDKSIQRAGRTGRCCPGKVFRMVPYEFWKQFHHYAEPELLTAPLELSVLRVKNFQMGEVKALLAVVLDPPPICEIRTAMLELKQIGALTSTYEGKISDIDGDLTELGKVISALPIDVHLSKLIVIASVLDVLEDAIIVAACLSTNRSVVKHLYNDPLVSYQSKLEWARGSFSDLFVSLDIYKGYQELKEQNKSLSHLENYCNNRHLDEKKLHEVSCLVSELRTRLQQMNIEVIDQPNRERNVFEDELMLKIAFCASFYPNYFLSEDMDAQEIDRLLMGLDASRTVILQNFPVNRAAIYRNQVSKMLKDRGIDNDYEYIADNSRALLVFNERKKMPKNGSTLQALNLDGLVQDSKGVEDGILKALKMPDCSFHHEKLHILEYKEEFAIQRLRHYQDQREQLTKHSKLIPGRLKVVDRQPENGELAEMTNEKWEQKLAKEYFIEVRSNKIIEDDDMSKLTELRRMVAECERQDRLDIRVAIDNHLFDSVPKIIRGPFSPIQQTFRSVLEKSRGYRTDVDHLSVNSILLNPDYNKPRRQMLVAASVSQSKRNRILACDTTLMPNIRGLPTIMSLLFAQYYRLIYSSDSRCMIGAVFGLGWNQDDEPIDRQYEVELGFDVHVTRDDVALINKARETISELIRFIEVRNPGCPQAELQERLRSIILSLIRKRRYPMDEINISAINWSTGRYIKDTHNVPKSQLTRLEQGKSRIFLPVMEISYEFDEFDMYDAIRENLDFLSRIELLEEEAPKEGVRCLLCPLSNKLLMRPMVIQHLDTDEHIRKLEVFQKAEERAKRRRALEANESELNG